MTWEKLFSHVSTVGLCDSFLWKEKLVEMTPFSASAEHSCPSKFWSGLIQLISSNIQGIFFRILWSKKRRIVSQDSFFATKRRKPLETQKINHVSMRTKPHTWPARDLGFGANQVIFPGNSPALSPGRSPVEPASLNSCELLSRSNKSTWGKVMRQMNCSSVSQSPLLTRVFRTSIARNS